MEQGKQEECMCPPKPYWSPGSLVAGSATETAAHERWERDHGHHPNANGGAGFLTPLQKARVRMAAAQDRLRSVEAEIVAVQRTIMDLEVQS